MHPPLPLQLRQTAAVIILITCRLVACILYPAASAAQGCTAVFRAQKGTNNHAFFDDLHPA